MSSEETKKNKLIGHEVRLDPRKGGMLIDTVNGFNFNFIEEGNDKVVVEEGIDTSVIERNIKAGVLRVFKINKNGDEKDVTTKFGGPASSLNGNKPIVPKAIKRPENFDSDDERLVNVLNINDPDKIEKYVQSISDYRTIHKLIELEKQGNNPTSQCRRSVLDMLVDRSKHLSGVSSIEHDISEDETVVVTAR